MKPRFILFTFACSVLLNAVLAGALLVGCNQQAPPGYLSAERRTYDAWARYVRKYKQAYPGEAGEIDDLYAAWGKQIGTAEGRATAEGTPTTKPVP